MRDYRKETEEDISITNYMMLPAAQVAEHREPHPHRAVLSKENKDRF